MSEQSGAWTAGETEIALLTFRQWGLLQAMTAGSGGELWEKVEPFLWEPAELRLVLVQGLGAQWVCAQLRPAGPHEVEASFAMRTGGFYRLVVPTCDLRQEFGVRAEILTSHSHQTGAAISGHLAEVTIVSPQMDDAEVRRVCRSSRPTTEAPPVVLGNPGPGNRWAAYPAWHQPGASWADSGAYVVEASERCGAITGSYPLRLLDRPEPLQAEQ
jgi:hypothetical protein